MYFTYLLVQFMCHIFRLHHLGTVTFYVVSQLAYRSKELADPTASLPTYWHTEPKCRYYRLQTKFK